MSKFEKFKQKVLSGTNDKNISFSELVSFLGELGFDEHIRGEHHIFTKSDVLEIINLQPLNGQAKAYQVKQVRRLLLKYKMGDKK